MLFLMFLLLLLLFFVFRSPQRVEEQLRSWEEIMKDENEAMKFRVGGRHHQYLGEQ
jgi:hypothetical protein